MNVELNQEIESDGPKFNQDLLNGLAYTVLANAKDDMDRIIYCASKSFPAGFEFVRSVPCSPQEAIEVMTGKLARADRPTPLDMSPSDIWMIRYEFELDGTPMYPRYLNMPVPGKGDLLTITAKRFAISPVLADPGFSVTRDEVFIRMTRAPVTFRRSIHMVSKYDAETSRKDTGEGCILGLVGELCSQDVPYSKLHWKGGTNDKTRESDSIKLGQVVTNLPHYLFCKYGVEETFRKFADCPIKFYTEDEIVAMGDGFDHDQWVIYGSRKLPPSALKNRVGYHHYAPKLMVLIPRTKVSLMTETLISGFFYVLDHFPHEATVEMVSESVSWRVWLGYILWGDQLGKGKLNENVSTHLKSLDDYVDIQVQETLFNEEGLEIEDIYDLFGYIICNMKDLINAREDNAASMFGKRLMVTPYVMKDIYEQIFKFLFEIINNRKRTYTAADYNQALGRFFSPSKIFDLRKTSERAFINSISTPGDSMFYKGTSRLTMQSQTGQKMASSSKSLNLDDPSNWLHPSALEAGNTCVMQKSFPLPKGMINPCVRLDKTHKILPKPEHKELREYVMSRIQRS